MKRFTALFSLLALVGFLGVQGCERRTEAGKTVDKAVNGMSEAGNDAKRGVQDALD